MKKLSTLITFILTLTVFAASASAATTYRTGPLSVPQTWQADLDGGSINSGTKDFWFNALTERRRFLEPMNGAEFRILPNGAPSYERCSTMSLGSGRIRVHRLTVGTYVCYRTSEGRYGVLRINADIGASPGTMEIGFTTWEDEEEVASVTYRTALLEIPQTWHADLDTGSIHSGTNDFWFRARTATNRYLQPQNGARFGIYGGGGGISKQDCVDTPKSTNNIPVGSLSNGTYVCYRTSDGRHGVFRINAPIGASPGTMEIGFTTWE